METGVVGRELGELIDESVTLVCTDPVVGVGTGAITGDISLLQRLISALSAAQVVRIAQFAARSLEHDPEQGWREVTHEIGHLDEFASDTLAPMLGMSHGPAAKRVSLAVKLAADLPTTLAALAGGRIDLYTALVIAEELLLADPEVCAAVEEDLYPDVCDLTPARTRARVRRALERLDPEAVRQAAARARMQRFVTTRASHLPGVTEWWAQLPAEDSVRCWAAIDALAHQRRNDDPATSLDQARADALVDLILGNATIETALTIVVPVDTSTADQDHGQGQDRAGRPDDQGCESGNGPRQEEVEGLAAGQVHPDGDNEHEPGAAFYRAAADDSTRTTDCTIRTGQAVTTVPPFGVYIPGIGSIPRQVALALAGQVEGKVTRMLMDATTGVTLETGASSYRPPAAIARHVRLRDQTCRFPGCAVRAQRCEIDHIIRWPDGSTTVVNLICLCKHHHRLKHHTRWRVERLDDGSFRWTDPYGTEYLVKPPDHRDLSTV